MSKRKDPLAILETLQRIEVGPVRVEPRRVKARYTLVRGGRRESTDLIYRFHEPVFDRRDPASVNLACMVVAQVAINYSQFASEIVFRGLFDAHDRRFIREAMENTAREIFVKKILQHNPFLNARAAHLPPVRRASYVRARIRYLPQPGGPRTPPGSAAPAPGDPRRSAVLSSGGKESLLTFCLLQELGLEVHPVFVTESGRHWYTALNAYRSFARRQPHTTRVWTNVDRVMCWVERRLGFIRPDFHNQRTDEYPVRLWTLPLFLFGVLPLARARRIGNLNIGDEFDTSRRYHHRGIPHFDGLYDQSRYFDNFMTRYYTRKGWGFRQFSVVRPMSELLVQKILVKRYPEVQRDQVSCHATHIRNHRVLPCGDCEKCRRIVGMLLALGEDPRRCGYTRQQIRQILKALPHQDFRQESAGAQQMAFLLARRGLFPKHSTHVHEHPEVLKLRFDEEHSPIHCTPEFLRRGVWRLCLRYAAGSARLREGRWTRFDPLRHPDGALPYPFD